MPPPKLSAACKKAFSGARRGKTTTPKHPHAHPLLLCNGCHLLRMLFFPTNLHACYLS
jgi:hypothetical protein